MDVENLLVKASDHLSVRRAFGTAYEKDGMLIIPVAIVAGGGGGTDRTGHGNSAAHPSGPPEEDPAAQDSAPHDSAPHDSAPHDSAPHDSAPHDSAPQDSGRMDAGGGFGGLVLPSGAYVVKGDRAETRLRPPQARRGVFALGAMPRSYM
jgi:hypothetical protein